MPPISVVRAMLERIGGDAAAERPHRRLVRDGAERQHGAQLRKARDRRHQELPAGGDLGADRLVLRRHAAHRIGDRRADQLQPVVRPRLEVAAREAEARSACGRAGRRHSRR